MRQSKAFSPRADLAELDQLLAQLAELEAELEHIRAELTHSHRLATVGTLTSTIAHEYNNILTPIISYAQFALSKPDDQALMRKAVEKALSGAQRAAQISSSLLGFAREGADAGPAELRRVVAEALTCLGRPPEKDGIALVVDVPDVRLAMSELNLQQVLMNLILNARKAMRPTGGSLSIRGRVEGDQLQLDVADTGPGIAPELQAKLFEPFVTGSNNHHTPGNGQTHAAASHASDSQASDHAAPDHNNHADHNHVDHAHANGLGVELVRCDSGEKGTGLGLSICRNLLRHAAGDIDVTSTPGQGATFHLTIPLADTGEVLTT